MPRKVDWVLYAVVAQLEEHAPDKREVVRSGLTVGTTGEGASAFDLFKKAPSSKENESGYNRQISFSMAP